MPIGYDYTCLWLTLSQITVILEVQVQSSSCADSFTITISYTFY